MRPRHPKEAKTILFPPQLACMTLPAGFPLYGRIMYRHRFQGYGANRLCRRCGEPEKAA